MKRYQFLANVLSYFVPHKLLKLNYKHPPCMNPKISSSLRKRAKLTKLFYENPSDSLRELLMSRSIEHFQFDCYSERKLSEKDG